jgi:hypothetical protein
MTGNSTRLVMKFSCLITISFSYVFGRIMAKTLEKFIVLEKKCEFTNKSLTMPIIFMSKFVHIDKVEPKISFWAVRS